MNSLITDEPPETIMLVHEDKLKSAPPKNETKKNSDSNTNDFSFQNVSVPSYIHFKDKDSTMWTLLALFFFIALLFRFYKKK
jgi:hypothetical protein